MRELGKGMGQAESIGGACTRGVTKNKSTDLVRVVDMPHAPHGVFTPFLQKLPIPKRWFQAGYMGYKLGLAADFLIPSATKRF